MVNLHKIKVIAKEQGIAINDLAEQLGMTPQAVHLMVRENSTKTDTLERIAQILQVPITIFFDDVKETIRQNQNGGSGNKQAGGNFNEGLNLEEHDELIRLREDVKSLNQQLKEKDDKLKEAKDSKDRELAAKDAIIAELRVSLDRVQKMNDYLMGQK